jgi:hypothetical protein
LKRTIAAAIATVTAGTSMWLAASAAGAAAHPEKKKGH